MPTNYPASADDFPDPNATMPLNSGTAPHATLHANINAAVEKIEQILGTNPQGTFASVAVALQNKANSTHTHAIADVTSLSTTLAAKSAIGHTHAIADTTSLQAALDAKPTVASTNPVALASAAAVGTSITAARSDHAHPYPTTAQLGAAAATTSVIAGTGLTGGGDLSTNRTLTVAFTTSGGDSGVASTVARGDHTHDTAYYTRAQSDSTFATSGHLHDARYPMLITQTSSVLPSATSYPEGAIVAIYS